MDYIKPQIYDLDLESAYAEVDCPGGMDTGGAGGCGCGNNPGGSNAP